MPRPVSRPAAGFGDRVAHAVERSQSQVLLGLDPDPARLLPDALGCVEGGDLHTAGRPGGSCGARPLRALVDAVAAGVCGGEAPAGVLRAARRTGLGGARATWPATRGPRDCWSWPTPSGETFPTPRSAYAQALLGSTETPWGAVEGLGADAVTANPLLGRDSLEPIVTAAARRRAGVFVLVRDLEPRRG